MLRVNNLSAGYDNKIVLQGVSFTLQQGGSLAIIGPNGCGKTTLLRAVAGIIPSGGSITLDDKPLADYPRRELAKKIAMLSQLTNVYFDYNIYDTVMMGRYSHGKRQLLADNTEQDRAMTEQALRQVRLWDIRQRSIATLSGGQLQRVFLARLLAQQPDIILLDEPTNHLDLSYQVELIDFLRRYAGENNKSVMGVLHDINLALRLADQLLLMHEGTVRALGSPSEVLAGDTLREVYGIDVAGYMRQSLALWENL